MDRCSRRPGEQPEGCSRPFSDRKTLGHHWNFRLREVNIDAGRVWPAVREQLNRRKRSGNGKLFRLVSGATEVETVYEVDQSPIGKTSRSTPATYIKAFDEIRNLYAQLPVSRVRGYSASRFSFNAQGGRCESCKGQGVIKLEMNFLPSSYVPCEDCRAAVIIRRRSKSSIAKKHR